MRLWIVLIVLFSTNAFASSADCDETTPAELRPVIAVAEATLPPPPECPNRKKLKNLCMMIGDQMADPKQPEKYMYETRFYQAGCVNDGDSEEVKKQKIRNAWNTYEDDLKCNNNFFDVSDGHLLKYAVASNFTDFLDDAIKWQVNLNKVDAADGRTVLDYVQFHLEKSKGGALEPILKSYYLKLREAGAKHKSEL